ncbi:MurR/RpiR family transcriptional regulator [Allocoprobacillus halotolerans]|uniref:MurR/RpiR family transcriptional regulator n=1 Tax=Allocoprobacillus halotolerans TaxID=2944914 RepID=A0ABY5I4T5_9FIRM|nr:MurR/RpiR family transcriptional regulator [Allocoprobacillus halotolerans]UTY39058.1 MurR/RpiR family transcriptional regulator [Allocoprobacillus halotolerans]
MNIFTKIKQIDHFTESEKIFASYIINYPHEVLTLDLQQLVKKSYVSSSTIYRVIEKLGLSGLNQLKVQISLQLENRKQEKQDVDYNYPFHKLNTHHQIMSKMLSLYDQTLKSTFNLVDLDVFLEVIQTLYNANNIIMFPSIGNYFMVESFQQNMLEIGVSVEVVKERFYQHWTAQSCKKSDVVVIVSYAGKTPYLNEIVKTLKEKNVKMVLISSTVHIPFAKYIDYHLYFSSYEASEEKIASFSSRISLQYLLDCIYACYFNRDYDKNLDFKINNYID